MKKPFKKTPTIPKRRPGPPIKTGFNKWRLGKIAAMRRRKMTYEKIGEELDITKTRVGQIIKRGIEDGLLEEESNGN